MYIPAWPSLNPSYFLRPRETKPLPFPLNSSATTYFYVARNGIYHLFKRLQLGPNDAVLAPDYHHGNEIYAIRAAGAAVTYYPIKRDLTLDLDVVETLCRRRPRVLYVTHFIGWPQPMEEIQALCRRHDIMLIEDCALSLLSSYRGAPLGAFGDYSVFCLYKTLPLPNGGVLVRNTPTAPVHGDVKLTYANKLSVAARSLELMLQWIRIHYERCGRALFEIKRRAGRGLSAARIERAPVGNTGFDASAANVAMSAVSRRLLDRFDYDEIRRIRQRNFRFLHDALAGRAALLPIELTEDVCPLFFPLPVKDKAFAARALWQRGIDVVEFWNEGDPAARRDGSDAAFLRRHVLEIPIHQDVTLKHLHQVAELTMRLGLCR